jgi:hypothetical protein
MCSVYDTGRVALLEHEIGGFHSGVVEDLSLVDVVPCRLVRYYHVKYPVTSATAELSVVR